MRNKFVLLCAICLFAISGFAFAAETHLRLATTTSTDNTGLLAVLLPPFEEEYKCKVDVIAVGTGRAIKLGEKGDVDVVLVHARKKENAFVKDGFGIERRDVMYNDFILLGPKADPAEVKGVSDVADAMRKISARKFFFVSRGDDSGTHSREKQLWQKAGVIPSGDWYLEAGRGMGEVLVMADERQGYTLSDRGTYLAFLKKTRLEIVLEGDRSLFNPYGVIMVNPEKHPHVNADLAAKFIDYLTSVRAKALIDGFRRNGEQLFYVQ